MIELSMTVSPTTPSPHSFQFQVTHGTNVVGPGGKGEATPAPDEIN
jgi:hypothetical protein